MTTRETPHAEAQRLLAEILHHLEQYRGVQVYGLEVQYPSGQVLVNGEPLRVEEVRHD